MGYAEEYRYVTYFVPETSGGEQVRKVDGEMMEFLMYGMALHVCTCVNAVKGGGVSNRKAAAGLS